MLSSITIETLRAIVFCGSFSGNSVNCIPLQSTFTACVGGLPSIMSNLLMSHGTCSVVLNQCHVANEEHTVSFSRLNVICFSPSIFVPTEKSNMLISNTLMFN
ncbi:hypothetical protein PUN28_009118 [Cardiocondyla obscurior]|uniref:Secreted protein n=1 Tax=Cardiocondyla obscurior TaxID=286306 RepID=A0AAW2FU19_9HYME